MHQLNGGWMTTGKFTCNRGHILNLCMLGVTNLVGKPFARFMKESSRLLRVGWEYDLSFEVRAFSLAYRMVEFLFSFQLGKVRSQATYSVWRYGGNVIWEVLRKTGAAYQNSP